METEATSTSRKVRLSGPNFRKVCRLVIAFLLLRWWPVVKEMAITSKTKITSVSLTEFLCATSKNLGNDRAIPEIPHTRNCARKIIYF